MAEVICWKPWMTAASSSHSPSCAARSNCIRLAPTEKFSRSLAMTKPAKSRTASESGWSTAETSASTSPPMAFLSECSSMQPMPSPRSMRDAPGFVRTTPLVAAEVGDAGVAGDCGDGLERLLLAAGSRAVRRSMHRGCTRMCGLRRARFRCAGLPAGREPSCG